METYPQALLGYRLLRYSQPDGQLYSLHADHCWLNKVMSAHCNQELINTMLGSKQPVHQAPGNDCLCGFYAWHDFKQVFEYLERNQTSSLLFDRGKIVIAAVAAAGKIEIHNDGWRAGKCQLLALYSPIVDLRQVAIDYRLKTFTSDCDFLSYAQNLAARPVKQALLPKNKKFSEKIVDVFSELNLGNPRH